MKKADLFEIKDEKKVLCTSCEQRCIVPEGKTGLCGVRKNTSQNLFLMVYGKVVAKNIDPLEKKPLFHFLPGTYSYSIGTFGCNFKCAWCQNFDLSRFSSEGRDDVFYGQDLKPEEIVNNALENGCKSIAYTYNDPSIFVEFVKDTAKIAKKNGLKNILVTNGYMTKESFDYLSIEESGKTKSLIDAMNIDLKAFNNETYKKYCSAKKGIKPVLETIKRTYKAGIHLEITTLVIPDLNDSSKELSQIAEFIFNLDKKGKIPWHISRFFPMHKFSDKEPTPIETLNKAKEIGKKQGLKNIHLGNI